jgi:hypothetical protein
MVRYSGSAKLFDGNADNGIDYILQKEIPFPPVQKERDFPILKRYQDLFQHHPLHERLSTAHHLYKVHAAAHS